MTKRPVPPPWPSDVNHPEPYRFAPAPEIYDWLHESILCADSPIYNEAHEHLVGNDTIAFMWAESSVERHQRVAHGQAELIAIRGGAWSDLRRQSQLEQWFGVDSIPKAIITLSAGFARQADDRTFCALVEHQLYHLAHKHTHMGPCYDKCGRAVVCMRGHDVEEFNGVVRRYGMTGEVRTMVEIANQGAEVSQLNIAHACGTCMLRLA